jgi:hypothetical protein
VDKDAANKRTAEEKTAKEATAKRVAEVETMKEANRGRRAPECASRPPSGFWMSEDKQLEV